MRTAPPEWDIALLTGDRWAATAVAVVDYSHRWDQLDPADTWADEVGAWEDDLYGSATPCNPIEGSVTADLQGAVARTTATVTVAGLPAAGIGKWLTVTAHMCPPDEAPPDGDPAGVPAVQLATLWIVGAEHDPSVGVTVLAAEDLVTILGARILTPSSGIGVGYLPAARTVITAIRELVDTFGPAYATVPTTTAPDTPWTPALDDGGAPAPLTGTAWAAIEDLAGLGSLALVADGPRLHLAESVRQQAHSGLTVTASPDMPGIQALPGSRRTVTPATTRVIATAQDTAGDPVSGIARDAALAAAQGFDVDDTITVNAVTDPTALAVAAQARLNYLRTLRDTGILHVPWMPHLTPGDLLTVAWTPDVVDSYYIDQVTIDLDPATPTELGIRGPSLARWQDEPAGQPWNALPPALTWAQDT